MHDFSLSSKFIAPWALASEKIPIHLMWTNSIIFEKIEIITPPDLEINDYFNVDDVVFHYDRAVITKLKTPNYFGFIVSTKGKISDIHISRDIQVNFINKEKIIFSEVFQANIFRPILKVIEVPSEFTLSDDVSKNNLDITIEVSGFGRVQVRNDVSTGGHFRTQLEPLYNEILRRIITTFDSDVEISVGDDIKINPKFVQEKAEEFAGWIKEGRLPVEFDNADLDGFKTWIYDETNYQKVIEVISKHLEEILINSLIYYLERNPEDNITMVQGKPTILIDEFTHLIKIRLRYRDSMLNEYDPLLIEIKMNDIRKEKNDQIELPINIKWKLNIVNPIEYCGLVR